MTEASLLGQRPPRSPSLPRSWRRRYEHFETLRLRENNAYGFKATFNATIADRSSQSRLWISPYHFGINQGPVSLDGRKLSHRPHLESYASQCPYLVAGLRRAGFSGGWLGAEDTTDAD